MAYCIRSVSLHFKFHETIFGILPALNDGLFVNFAINMLNLLWLVMAVVMTYESSIKIEPACKVTWRKTLGNELFLILNILQLI